MLNTAARSGTADDRSQRRLSWHDVEQDSAARHRRSVERHHWSQENRRSIEIQRRSHDQQRRSLEQQLTDIERQRRSMEKQLWEMQQLRQEQHRRSSEAPRRSSAYVRNSMDLTQTVIDERLPYAHASFADNDVEGDDESEGRRPRSRPRSRAASRQRVRGVPSPALRASGSESPRPSYSQRRSHYDDSIPVASRRSSSLQIDRADFNADMMATPRASQDTMDRNAFPASASSRSYPQLSAQRSFPRIDAVNSQRLAPIPQEMIAADKDEPVGAAQDVEAAQPTSAPPAAVAPKSEATSGWRKLFGLGPKREAAPEEEHDEEQSAKKKTKASSTAKGNSETPQAYALGTLSASDSNAATQDSATSPTMLNSSDDKEQSTVEQTPRPSTSGPRPDTALNQYNSAIRQKLAAFESGEQQSLYAHPDREGEILLAHDQPAQQRKISTDQGRPSMASYRRGGSMDAARTLDTGADGQTRDPALLDVPAHSIRGPSMDLRRSVDGLRQDIRDHKRIMSPTMVLKRSVEIGRSMDLARPSTSFSAYGRDSLARSSNRPSLHTVRNGSASVDDNGFASLDRVTSEPVRGGPLATAPFSDTRRFQHSAPPYEDITDMKSAVAAVGTVLEERRRRGLAASRSKDGRFWLAFTGIAVTGFLSATDMTIIAPILPTIAADLPPSEISATWITSAFLLTMTAFQPLWGGVSDAIGRRSALLASLFIFLAGSIPCTIAQSMLTMVAGRGLQGVGGGGMLVVGEVMLSDMTTLAERGYFLGLLSMAFAAAAIAAPLAGGALATVGGLSWRWAFLINFPIGVVAGVFVFAASHLRVPKLTLQEKIAHLDAPSSIILFGATLSLLIGLTRGAEEFGWSSAGVIAPLVFGVVGYVLFFAVQWWPRHNKLAPRPVLSRVMFFSSGRTAAISFTLTFLHGLLLYGAVQTLILYFEARDASPLQAAINVLPANVPSTPAAFVAGVLMAVTGRYKMLIVVSQLLMLVGFGMLVYLDDASPTYQWALFQVIASLGIGALYTLTLPPIQASVPQGYLARATATFAFVRSFGAVWGVSATLVAYSAQAGRELALVPGAAQAGLSGATAIASTTSIRFLPLPLRNGVRDAIIRSLRVAFASLVPFAFIGLVLALFIRHVPLPNFNSSEFGLDDGTSGPATTKEWSDEDGKRNAESPPTGTDLEKGAHDKDSKQGKASRQGPQLNGNVPDNAKKSFASSLRRSNSFYT